MNNIIFLFDVDGTLAESGQEISISMRSRLQNLLAKGVHIGIVGGGKLEKILQQIGDVKFHHYFSECGCVYHKQIANDDDKLLLEKVYCKNIREHSLYPSINILIKETLFFLSQVKYTLTGNFVDLRNGIIYISLIGMSATNDERTSFIALDGEHNYRMQLIELLHNKAIELDIISQIDIVEGGSVGIAIYPKEYDKVQVLGFVTDKYKQIHYFGDKYRMHGNDYKIIFHPSVVGHCIDSPNDTLTEIDLFLNNNYISNAHLRKNVYDIATLELNIDKFSLWTLLRTQTLTADFCVKNILDKKMSSCDEGICIADVLNNQPHITEKELLDAIRKKQY